MRLLCQKLWGISALAMLLFLLAHPFNTMAQEAKVVKGVVTDTKGGAVEAVTVKVKGTDIQTITASNGSFTIKAPQKSILVFSFVGFETFEQTIGNEDIIKITLTEKSAGLSEVVVVGYGTVKRRDLTGTVGTITNDEIVRSRASNAQQAMQGRIAGVDVKRTSGKPGSDFTIEIRGVNSSNVNGNTQPLYVIDGIQVENINDINPSDIDRIDVLKDASSTAIYGSRGANGVVLVTTKRGTTGAVKISYDGYYGVVQPYNLPQVMNGPQFVDYARNYYLMKNGAFTPDANIFSATELTNIANNTYTDWISLIKQNGVQSNHNLSVSGGDSKTSYVMSLGYQSYEGGTSVENTKKYTLKMGLDKTMSSWLKAGGSMYGSWVDQNPGSGEMFRSAYRLRPTGSAYNADGSNRFIAYEGESQITNPLFDVEGEIRRTQYLRLIPNVYTEATLFKGLKFRTSFTSDLTFRREGTYNDTYSKSLQGTKAPQAENYSKHWVNYTFENTLNYNKQIKDHKIDFLAGTSAYSSEYDEAYIKVTSLPYRSLWYNVGSATTVTFLNASGGLTTQSPTTTTTSLYQKQTIASFFGRFVYSYKGRYLLTLNAREDGNSMFSDYKKWGFFPSMAASWVISDEAFMKNFTTINYLKIRAGYGNSGNAARTNLVKPYFTQPLVTTTYYDFNGAIANGQAPGQLGNYTASWETTNEYNVALEANLFNARLNFDVEYYHKVSNGGLSVGIIPAVNGFTLITTNLGSVLNKGIEANLHTVNIKKGKFTWRTDFNVAINKNILGTDDPGNYRFAGGKVRIDYGYKKVGVWQSADSLAALAYGQRPGQYRIEDVDNNKVINSSDNQVLGSDIPDWFGGATSTFNYGRWDLSATIYTRQGTVNNSSFLEKFVDDDQGRVRFNAYQRNYWTYKNPTNDFANQGIEQDANRRYAARQLNSSYTKISNITLGYAFPKSALSKVKINSLRIYATATDPFIFTKFIGWDPETASFDTFLNQDFKTRTFLFGVSLGL